jgi:hypothetical protein
MKDNQTVARFLKVKTFPFIINDDKGNEIYCEWSTGFWTKYEYDDQSNPIYFEDTNGYWTKLEYDKKGNQIYFEDSDGLIIDKRPKPMIELTLEDIAKLKGVDVSQIRIKE